MLVLCIVSSARCVCRAWFAYAVGFGHGATVVAVFAFAVGCAVAYEMANAVGGVQCV